MWIIMIIMVLIIPFVVWSICHDTIANRRHDQFKQYLRTEYRNDYNNQYCRQTPSPDRPYNREDY